MAKNTGARGLRAILENILTDAMFEVYGPSYQLVIAVTEKFTWIPLCCSAHWGGIGYIQANRIGTLFLNLPYTIESN